MGTNAYHDTVIIEKVAVILQAEPQASRVAVQVYQSSRTERIPPRFVREDKVRLLNGNAHPLVLLG